MCWTYSNTDGIRSIALHPFNNIVFLSNFENAKNVSYFIAYQWLVCSLAEYTILDPGHSQARHSWVGLAFGGLDSSHQEYGSNFTNYVLPHSRSSTEHLLSAADSSVEWHRLVYTQRRVRLQHANRCVVLFNFSCSIIIIIFNVHILPRLIKGMDGCFPTA